MKQVKNINGISTIVNFLEKQNILVSYENKSEVFKSVVKSKNEMICFYKDLLLNGSQDSLYLKDYLNKIKMENSGNYEEIKKLQSDFKNEIKNDINIITQKSNVIKRNRLDEKSFYNAETLRKLINDFIQIAKNSEFFDVLSDENKTKLEKYLNIQDIALGSQKQRAEMREIQAKNAINNTVIPMLEKFADLKNEDIYKHCFEYGARMANSQINIAPTSFDEYRTRKVNPKEAQLFYDTVNFLKDFEIEYLFEPKRLFENNPNTKILSVDNYQKTKTLTPNDIKLIFSNAKKFNRPDLQIDYVRENEDLHAEISNEDLKKQAKNDFKNNIDYNQFLVNIKLSLDEVLNGKKISQLPKSIAPYVQFLVENCPNIEYMANLNLADCNEITLSTTNDVSKLAEPIASIPRFLVDNYRFTKKNVEDLLYATIANLDLKDLKTDNVRLDVVARVLNTEIDSKFLTEEESKVMSYINIFYHSLSDDEKNRYMTSKQDYLEKENNLLTEHDLMILLENIPDGALQSFRVTKDDFVLTVSGKKARMLEQFNCSYEEFFKNLHDKYVEYVALGSDDFIAAGDPYFKYVKFIMSYCKDITYAPSVELTNSRNAEEKVFIDEENKSKFPYTNSKKYASIVLNLPSVQKAIKQDALRSWNYNRKVRYIAEINELNMERKMLTVRYSKLEAKMKKARTVGNVDAINYFASEMRKVEYKVRNVDLLIADLQARMNHISEVDNIIKGKARQFEMLPPSMLNEDEMELEEIEDVKMQQIPVEEDYILDEIDMELEKEFAEHLQFNNLTNTTKADYDFSMLEELVEEPVEEEKKINKTNKTIQEEDEEAMAYANVFTLENN